MDILASVCLLAIFSNVLGDSDVPYYILNTKTTWADAVNSNECRLATPMVNFTTGAILEDLGVTINEDVWIGYYKARSALEYIGCARKYSTHNVPVIYTKSDPGQCLSACMNSKVIGIHNYECYCYGNTVPERNITFSHCDTPCSDINRIVCGGVHESNSYISLYRSIKLNNYFNPQNDDEKDYCAQYDKRGLLWNDCNKWYKVICESANRVWILHTTDSFKWSDATRKCLANQSIPSTYNNTITFKVADNSSELWTGIVRSQVIYKVDSYNNYQRANKFGYIKEDKGNLEFKTTHDPNKRLKRLCVKTTTGSPDIESSSTTPKMTTPTTETSETKSTYDPAKGNQQNESSNVGAIIGATLTIVILIVIAIAAVIYVRKWGFKLPPFLKKEKREPPPSNANNNNAYVISRPVEILQSSYKTDTDNYTEIDLTTTSYNEGSRGNASGKAQVGDDEEDASPYSHDYFVLEKVDEGEYDTTKDADQNQIPKPNPNTFNLYNKLDFEQSSNYDHIGASKGANAKRHVSDSENTYNTTDTGYLQKSIGKTDNDYDTADGTEDDTYNHTNIQGHKKGLGTSENDYDAI